MSLVWKIVNKRVNFHVAKPLKHKSNPTRNSRLDLFEISYYSKWKSKEKFCNDALWIGNVLLADKIIDFNWPLENSNMHFLEFRKILSEQGHSFFSRRCF